MVERTPGILESADPVDWPRHRFGLPADRWARLKDRAFWVTGAGSGYGRAISVALAAAGAKVMLSGRRREKLQVTLEEAASLGIDIAGCAVLPLDVTAQDQVQAAADAISCRGGLTGLVNNAALPAPGSARPLQELGAEAWRRLIETNLTGPWLLSRSALPLMLNGGTVRMLFMSSGAGWAFTPGVGPYNVSKAALNNLSGSLAAEVAATHPEADVQINALNPGEARSEMNGASPISPYAVVSMVLTLLSHPPGGPNGRFFHRDGRHLRFTDALAHDRPLL